MVRESLLKAVEFACKGSRPSPYPQTETVLIDAQNHRMGTVTGTSLEVFLQHDFESDADVKCCVAANRLKRVLAALPDDKIKLSLDGDTLTISGAGGKSVPFKTLPWDKFPAMFSVDGEDFAIPAEAIKKCLPAVCTVATQENLKICGVALDKDGFVVGFDRRRLHRVQVPAMPRNATIPTEFAAILANLDGLMRLSDKFFRAEGEGWRVSGKLIEVPYQNWKSINNQIPAQQCPLPENLAECIQEAIACSEDPAKLPWISFESGFVEADPAKIPCDLDVGFRFRMGQNYLLQAIKAAGPGATFGYTNDEVLFTVSNGSFLAGIMPMKFSTNQPAQ